jgi:hypothetical protein
MNLNKQFHLCKWLTSPRRYAAKKRLHRWEKFALAATVVMAPGFANACAEAPGKSSDVNMVSRPTTLAAGEPEPPRVYLDTTRNAGADGKNIGFNLNKTYR